MSPAQKIPAPSYPASTPKKNQAWGRDVVIGGPCCLAAPAAPVRSQQALVALVGWEKTADSINSSSTSLFGQDAPLPTANHREAMQFTDATKLETTDAVPKIARQATRGKETVSCVTLLTTLLTSLKAHRPGGPEFLFFLANEAVVGRFGERKRDYPESASAPSPISTVQGPSNKIRSEHGVPAGPKLVTFSASPPLRRCK